jgi:hypothetical protein
MDPLGNILIVGYKGHWKAIRSECRGMLMSPRVTCVNIMVAAGGIYPHV